MERIVLNLRELSEFESAARYYAVHGKLPELVSHRVVLYIGQNLDEFDTEARVATFTADVRRKAAIA